MKIEEVKALQLQARKSGNKQASSLYTLVMGEYDTAKKAGRYDSGEVDQIVQKLIKSNTIMIDSLSSVGLDSSKEQYENELLSKMLPQMTSVQEIEDTLAKVSYSTISEALKVLTDKFGSAFDKKSAVKLIQKSLT